MFIKELLLLFPRLLFALLKDLLAKFVYYKKKSITDDIVLITGGGRGIGRQLAVEFSKYRPRLIILWGRNKDNLEATKKVLKMKNQACVAMCCDVSNKQDVYSKAKEIKASHGDVTILVNNAGVTSGHDLVNIPDSDLEKTLNTNALAHMWAAKAFLPSMLEQDHGHIVNINSMLGFMGLAGATEYTSSKHAAVGFSESLWFEIRNAGKHNVHITNVHPYIVDTEMFAGCETRYTWMFPPLQADYVAKRTVDATLTNTNSLLMPTIMYPVYWAKCLLPIECIWYIRELFWVDKAMDGFHKRKNHQSSTRPHSS